MTHLTRCGWFAASLLFSLTLPMVQAEDQPETKEPSQELTKPFVDDMTMIAIREDGTRYIVTEPRLIMRSFDHERGGRLDRSQTGAHWVWGTGRPVAITVFWRWKDAGSWGNSFISTSPGKVIAQSGQIKWEPTQGGLRFTRLDGAPAPANSAEERTFQMSEIAKRFSGYEMVRRRPLDLEILSGALHRYEMENVDGAIFGLARNESPYAYLFLEAVSDPIEPSYWRYGWIKGTSSPVTVELEPFVAGQPFNELLHIPGSLNFRGSQTEPFWVFFRRMPTKQNEPDTQPSEVSAQVE
jgi:hypothetical protein